MSYSQNDEEEMILRYFGRDPVVAPTRFLDIGAFDGVTYSNTRRLLELGWSGVMVEPDPFNLVKLIESTRPFYPRVEIIAAAVTPFAQGLVRLTRDDAPDRGWASCITPTNGIQIPAPFYLSVPTIHPVKLMEDEVFDFISIDAEWMDFDILRSLKHRVDGTSLLCIEAKSVAEHGELKEYLIREHGFKLYHETPENVLVCR